MTIRNFNQIISIKSTPVTTPNVKQVSSTVWDNKFNGLTFFNSQVSLSDSLWVTGNTTIGGKTDLNGDTTVTGVTALNGDATITGVTTLSSLLPADIVLDVTGGIDLKGDTTVTGKTTLSGFVNIDGDLISPTDTVLDVIGVTSLNGNTFVKGNTTLSGLSPDDTVLDVTGVTSLNGDTNVIGKTTLSGFVNIDGDLISPANIVLDVIGVTSLNGDTNVTGKTTLSGLVNTVGNLISPAEIVLDVNGKTKLTGDVEVVGDLIGPTNFFIKPLVNGSLTPTVTVEGDLRAVGLTYLTGNTTVTGSITLALPVLQSLVSSSDDVVVLDATGKTKLTGNVEVVGNVEVSGKLKGPNQFIIDPSPYEVDEADSFGGTVIINGNLTVKDLNITIASGAQNKGEAQGAGLTIKLGGTDVATLSYESTGDNFLLNKQIRLNADPSDGNDLARKSYVNKGENINTNSIGLNSLKGFKFKVISDTTELPLNNVVTFNDIIPIHGEPSIFYILNKRTSAVTVFEKTVKTGLSMLVYDGNEWFVE